MAVLGAVAAVIWLIVGAWWWFSGSPPREAQSRAERRAKATAASPKRPSPSRSGPSYPTPAPRVALPDEYVRCTTSFGNGTTVIVEGNDGERLEVVVRDGAFDLRRDLVRPVEAWPVYDASFRFPIVPDDGCSYDPSERTRVEVAVEPPGGEATMTVVSVCGQNVGVSGGKAVVWCTPGTYRAVVTRTAGALVRSETSDSFEATGGDVVPISVNLRVGSPGGVGVGFELGSDGIVVSNVLPGSPAARVGLEPGDVITAVDGESLFGVGVALAQQRITGEAGSIVNLTVQGADGEVFQVDVERAALEKE